MWRKRILTLRGGGSIPWHPQDLFLLSSKKDVQRDLDVHKAFMDLAYSTQDARFKRIHVMKLLLCSSAFVFSAFVLFFAGWVRAQEEPASTAALPPAAEASSAANMEADLDTFRKGLYTAFNEGRYEEMLTNYCHPDVVATWQDGSVSHGHAEVLAEFKKLSAFIDKIEVDPTIEKRLVLDGGKMVISTGKMKDKYKLKRGETVSLDSYWSGTIVRANGKWMLVSFSGVANSFDNSVIRLFVTESTNRMMLLSAAGGLFLGSLGGFWLCRKKPTSTP